MSYARTTNSPFYAYWKSTQGVTRWQDEILVVDEQEFKASEIDGQIQQRVVEVVPDGYQVENPLNCYYGRPTEDIRNRLSDIFYEFLRDVTEEWGNKQAE